MLILGLSEMKFNLSLNNCLMTTFVLVTLDSRKNMASIKVTSILVNLASTAVLLKKPAGNVEMDCNDNIFPA